MLRGLSGPRCWWSWWLDGGILPLPRPSPRCRWRARGERWERIGETFAGRGIAQAEEPAIHPSHAFRGMSGW